MKPLALIVSFLVVFGTGRAAAQCNCAGKTPSDTTRAPLRVGEAPLSVASGIGGEPHPPVKDCLDRAAEIFAGTFLYSKDPIPLSAPVPPTGLVFDYYFKTERVWKGKMADTLRVRSYRDIEGCGSNFNGGKVYLLFTYDHDGVLWTDDCTRTAEVENAIADLYRLGKPSWSSGSDAVPTITLDSLIARFKDPDLGTRFRAMDVAATLGEGYDRIAPALADIMKSGVKMDRMRAAQELARVGPGAAPAVPTLIEVLKDSDLSLVMMTVVCLDRIGPGAKSAVPTLIEMADTNKDASLRVSAVRALAHIAPRDPAVEAALERALHDSEPQVKNVAEQALQQIGGAKPEPK
jgi:hypothetical protein